MKKSEGLQAIEKPLASLPHAFGKHILEHIQKLTHYEPVIGIMGKTGSGKSSLCNALFQGEVTPVSDVNACTRDVLRLRLSSGDHSLILVDLPGVGESEQRDSEYESLYRKALPDMDLILWVIKADDRAFSVDERFYRRVMSDHQQRVLFVVNQADKIEPCHEWYVNGNAPSPYQLVNIEARLASIRQLFSPHHPVCAVSARTEWNLPSMIETMMCCLQDRATSPLATQLHGRLCSEPVKKQAREGFGNAVGEVFDSAQAASFIPAPLKAVIRTVRDAVVSAARAVWDWIFF
ncbi:GTPase family protein [Klebsiella sp. 1SOBk8mer]|uniref:GTPase family protein n=1 Tax=Klebsiella TaxID=570 RepID=UPI001083920F|nr:GTPase family protein [Klebsiella pneumoniae]UAA28958.1 GTPase family protein [Klebsiella pneumoniae]VGL24819.1 GTPase [Klebsiella pneumoniae]VGL69683.1 GTPase [Klebsiella pneumoniae]HBT7643676.1 GTPase family protein [Klebsiella pneumoniae]HBV3629523.1 GTPase family protein [Klebsiella pneumoniae]